MKKQILLLSITCLLVAVGFSQALFKYGNNDVSKEEFLKAYNKNMNTVTDKEKSVKDYLQLYYLFKLKVKAAKDLKIDSLEQVKYDLMNFRKRLETDYKIDIKEAIAKTKFKRNPAVKNEQLFQYADSVTLVLENRKYAIAKEVFFWLEESVVKVSEWLSYVKKYKLDYTLYKGENYEVLLAKFIDTTVSDYYRKHLEKYSSDFKYNLQEFKEGNLMFEIMSKKVWDKATGDPAAIKEFYDHNKEQFLWVQSADVILVNAKYFAYADYAAANIKNGQYWKKIAAESENMIQADSGRYEIAQLPIKPGEILKEGSLAEIVKNEHNNEASFVKVVKLYPAKMQRTFEESKSTVINEYQKLLEETWMNELIKKYPLKINNPVLQTMCK